MSAEWFWISFGGDPWLGGCYVEADGPLHPLFPEKDTPAIRALGKSHQLGINPGGRPAMMGPLSVEGMDRNVPEQYRNRLLTKSDLAELFPGEYVSTKTGDVK